MKFDHALCIFYREAFEEGGLWILYAYLRDHEGWTAEQFARRVEQGVANGEFGLYVYGRNDEFIYVSFDQDRNDIEGYWKELFFSPNEKTTELYNVYYERTRDSQP